MSEKVNEALIEGFTKAVTKKTSVKTAQNDNNDMWNNIRSNILETDDPAPDFGETIISNLPEKIPYISDNTTPGAYGQDFSSGFLGNTLGGFENMIEDRVRDIESSQYSDTGKKTVLPEGAIEAFGGAGATGLTTGGAAALLGLGPAAPIGVGAGLIGGALTGLYDYNDNNKGDSGSDDQDTTDEWSLTDNFLYE